MTQPPPPPDGWLPPGQPGAPAGTPGPPAHGYAPPGYGPPVLPHSTGAVAWGLGLLLFAFLPILSSLLAGIVMVCVGRWLRKRGELAAENGRRAANWGLTYTLITVAVWGGLLLTAALFPDAPIVTESYSVPPWPIMTWLIATAIHVVISIAGLAVALKGRVFRLPVIPPVQALSPRTGGSR